MARTTTLRLAAAGAAATLTLAACGGDDGDEAAVAASGSGEDTVQMVWNMWSGSTAEVEAWEHLSDMVTEEYPNIELEFRTSSFNDYWTRLAAQASGGDAGCILGVQSYRAPSVEELLLPLDEQMLTDAGIDTSEFESSIIEGLQVDGTQLGIPYDFGPLVMFYNATAFDEAGVERPTMDWTTEDFLAAAEQLTGEGRYGFALHPTIDSVIPWSLSMNGVQPVDESGEVDLTQPGFVEAAEWYVDLVEQGVAPEVSSTSDPTPALSKFISGTSAMTIDGPWQIVNVMDQADFEVGIAPIPAGEAGSASQAAGSGFGVSRNCETPEEALKAISVLTGPEALEYLAEQGRAYPARTAQQEAWFTEELESAREGLTTAVERSVPAPSTEDYTQLANLFTQYGVQAVNGQQDVQTWLETVQQQAGTAR